MTIGVMVDWINSRYHYSLIQGIEEAAAGKNINFLYFAGTGLVNLDIYHQHHHRIYELIQSSFLDALLVFPGVVGGETTENVLQFFQKFDGLRILTLCFQMRGHPCILLDNGAGLRALLNHLIERHHRKRLGFLKGAFNNYDSNERFAIFLEVMAAHQLPVNEQLIVENCEGIFRSGSDAARIILDQRKLIPGKDFDGLLTFNDTIASDAISFFTQHNYSIPRDLVICGFDDSEAARSSTPALSTVRQPFKEIAAAAVRYISGEEKFPETGGIFIPTQMIIRESCGCQITDIGMDVHSANCPPVHLHTQPAAWPGEKAQIRSILEPAMTSLAGNAEFNIIIAEFIDIVSGYAVHKDPVKVLACFTKIFTAVNKTGQDITLWYKTLTHLLIHIIRSRQADAAQQDLLISLVSGNLVMSSLGFKADLNDRIEFESAIARLQAIQGNVKIYSEYDQLLDNLTADLRWLGFTSYYLFHYSDLLRLSGEFRLILSVTDDVRDNVTNHNCKYRDFQEVHDTLLKRDRPMSYCILPLCENETIFGFIIYNKSHEKNAWIYYENYANQIGSIFKSNQLLNQTRSAYEMLKSTQQELQREMAAAFKIQRSLLPCTLLHDDFEMAAVMQTAVSVGGDYYDFISAGEKCWIVIGDVSGHGVHAGLMAMMVQTSIHTLLKKDPGIALPELLTRVNEVVAGNIAKLGELKFMTILVLAYQGNGEFIFSGMHLPLLVYRAATGRVETIDTEGVWLGIIPDIGSMNQEHRLCLSEGDGLLLYTDGIVEAASKADKHVMYGNHRLEARLQDAGPRPAQQIVDLLLADLAAYDYDDDVTLFVLKKI